MDINYLNDLCNKGKCVLCKDCVVNMYKLGLNLGLSGYDRYPYNNPQNLNMLQLEERIYFFDRYLNTKNDSFVGGAWSGD